MDRQEQDRQARDNQAKRRFMVISAMRLGGIAMVMMGIAIINGLVQLPDTVAYILVVLGVIETFAMPLVLARLWRSEELWRSEDKEPPSR